MEHLPVPFNFSKAFAKNLKNQFLMMDILFIEDQSFGNLNLPQLY